MCNFCKACDLKVTLALCSNARGRTLWVRTHKLVKCKRKAAHQSIIEDEHFQRVARRDQDINAKVEFEIVHQ